MWLLKVMMADDVSLNALQVIVHKGPLYVTSSFCSSKTLLDVSETRSNEHIDHEQTSAFHCSSCLQSQGSSYYFLD